MFWIEDEQICDWLIPYDSSNSKNINTFNGGEIFSVNGYKTTFVIKDNLAQLNTKGEKRIFKDFNISELEEIIKLINNKSLGRIKDKNASARKFLYYLKVWQETEINAIKVKDIRLRGKNYHLDHIIPITYCFYNNICHTKAGGLLNLQIISHIDNMNKSVKVNLSELYRVH